MLTRCACDKLYSHFRDSDVEEKPSEGTSQDGVANAQVRTQAGKMETIMLSMLDEASRERQSEHAPFGGKSACLTVVWLSKTVLDRSAFSIRR